jgi:hypothetical protein
VRVRGLRWAISTCFHAHLTDTHFLLLVWQALGRSRSQRASGSALVRLAWLKLMQQRG